MYLVDRAVVAKGKGTEPEVEGTSTYNFACFASVVRLDTVDLGSHPSTEVEAEQRDSYMVLVVQGRCMNFVVEVPVKECLISAKAEGSKLGF